MNSKSTLSLLLAVAMLGVFDFSDLQAAATSPAQPVCPCCQSCDNAAPVPIPCGHCKLTQAPPVHQQIVVNRPATLTPRIDVAMFSIVPVVKNPALLSVRTFSSHQVAPWPGRSCAQQAWLHLWLI